MSQHGCPERLSNRSKGYQEEGPSQPTMEVLVETLTGTAFEMTVSPSDTIFAIKSKIFRVEGIPVSQQHLLYNLKELEDGSSLRELGVGEGARLRLVLGLRGGPISMRRLPPPPQPDAPWPDIERLLDTNREEGEWESVGGGAGGGAGGCKVTVLVFRDGDRVNMLRVRENDDGTYSPIDHAKSDSGGARSVRASSGDHDDGLSGSVQENAVTMGKMLELRRRMESLSVQRATRLPEKGDKPELIQKTRSEETLAVPSLLDDSPSLLDEAGGDVFKSPFSAGYAEECAPLALYDGHYTRYDYDCSFTDRYTLLPPIVVPGSRTESEQSVREAVAAESDRLKLSDALAGSILVKSNRREGADEAAILEESVSFEGTVQHVHSSQHSASLADKTLAPLAHTEYGPLVVGSVGGWRVRGFGSSSQLAPPAPLAAAPPHHSASSLQLRAPAPHPRHQPPPAPLSDALFSSSTSDLEKLKRNRILPALSRHRNREHLHLSDEGLDMSVTSRPRNLEVGSERRQRRIKKIAELEHARTFQFDDPPDQGTTDGETVDTPDIKELEVKEVKKMRIRCGFCRKKLSIATVHKCRCGAEFCAPHRYAEVHGCAYDYKANAHQYLQRANPLVSAPKLPKI